jgi:hypothetical protein
LVSKATGTSVREREDEIEQREGECDCGYESGSCHNDSCPKHAMHVEAEVRERLKGEPEDKERTASGAEGGIAGCVLRTVGPAGRERSGLPK